jgi:CheY-like chemotaxis protein
MKVFIVDDDPEMIELMTLVLESAGHRVASSLAGAEAIPRIQRERPDCILIDLMMAELDGLALCRELRNRLGFGDVTVVFVSARSHQHWRERAREAGADGYVIKPFDPTSFAAQIERLAALQPAVD